MGQLSSIKVLAMVVAVGAAQTMQVTSASPIEAKLASLDAHATVVPLTSVRQFALLLDQIDPKCKESRIQIGDITVKGVQLLAEKKVPMSHLAFLRAMNKSIPKGSTLDLSCVEIGAILVTMTERP